MGEKKKIRKEGIGQARRKIGRKKSQIPKKGRKLLKRTRSWGTASSSNTRGNPGQKEGTWLQKKKRKKP